MPIMLLAQSPKRPSQLLRHASLISLVTRPLWLLLAVLIAVTIMAAPAHAAVTLRVEARPVSAPINVSVTVTDTNGNAVGGLTAADFSILVDGAAVAAPSFSLPPAQDVNKKVSVVFAMDYSASVQATSLAPMQEAVIAFVNSMRPGDYAAIIKFNVSNPNKASVVQPFTQIDGGAGTAALIDAVNAPYPGEGSNVLDAVLLSVQQFTAPGTALPTGPRAVVLVSDGAENSSSADVNAVVNAANEAKIAVFTVGVGDFTGATSQQILSGLAGQTSGTFIPAPSSPQIGEAYVKVSQLLNNEYLLTFQSSIGDCNTHTLEVRVTGQALPATASFTRCAPLFVPDVRGQTRVAATTELAALGLVVGSVANQLSSTVPLGSVINQDPPVGTAVLPGSTVNLLVSGGAPQQGSAGGGAIDPIELVGLLLFVALLAGRKRKPTRS